MQIRRILSIILVLLATVSGSACAGGQKEKDPLPDRRLAWAVCHSDVPAVRAALKAGADPNAGFPLWQYRDFRADDPPTSAPKDTRFKNEDGQQGLLPILFAAGPEMVQILVKAGADTEAVDSHGDTPLIYYAADLQLELDPDSDIGDHRNCDVAVLTALLKAGAKPNARDAGGNTALHLIHNCLRNDGPGRDNPDEVVAGIRLLVRHGADVNAKNNAGQTVLQATESSWSEGDTYGSRINTALRRLGARETRPIHRSHSVKKP